MHQSEKPIALLGCPHSWSDADSALDGVTLCSASLHPLNGDLNMHEIFAPANCVQYNQAIADPLMKCHTHMLSQDDDFTRRDLADVIWRQPTADALCC